MPGLPIIQYPNAFPSDRSLPRSLPHSLHLAFTRARPRLPSRQATLLRHRGVLLLESLAEPLGALEELVDAAHDAALLLGEEGLGAEVIDAVGEAALDKVRVHLHRRKVG